MPVERISYTLPKTQIKYGCNKSKNFAGKSITADRINDNTPTYMLGALALASFAAYGIFSDKKRLGKDINKLLKNGKNICIEMFKHNKDADIFPEDKLKKSFISKITKEIYCIRDFEPKTGNVLRNTYYDFYYNEDCKRIASVRDYDTSTYKLVKNTYFYENGKDVFYIREYDAATGNLKKDTLYHRNGDVSLITEYGPKIEGMDEDTYNFGDEDDISYYRAIVTSAYKKLKETCFDKPL